MYESNIACFPPPTAFLYVVLLEPEARPDLCCVTSTEPSENFVVCYEFVRLCFLSRKEGKNAYVQATHSVDCVFSMLEERARLLMSQHIIHQEEVLLRQYKYKAHRYFA